jgi:aldehyde:ferredoxin oxidoreductase
MQRVYKGYTGKLLRVNLTSATAEVESIPEQIKRDFLGGRGFGIKYLYDELAPGIEPLSPENKLLLLSGPLCGTFAQGYSRCFVATKSPASGGCVKSNAGGYFAARLKSAGFDLIIIEGKAPKPSYVYIEDEKVEVLDARELWGLNTEETQERLRQKHGAKTETACIGPAGESLIRYAVIINGWRTAARCGVGTVMGSKNLKAVAVNGTGRIVPYNPQTFKELVRKQVEALKPSPRRIGLTESGLAASIIKHHDRYQSPVRNYREGRMEGIEKLTASEFNKFKLGNLACYACLTRCGQIRKVTDGVYAGAVTDGPEYETGWALGTLLCNTDKGFVIAANALCDLFGLDVISIGVCIAFACELFERGIITSKDTDGLELTWGNHAAFYSLVDKIARREGFGKLLGEGAKRAAEQIGKGAERYAMHSKGVELAGYEPRVLKGYALSYAVSNVGGVHTYARPFDEVELKTDSTTEEGKGGVIAMEQKRYAIWDSAGLCLFGNPLEVITPELQNQLLAAGTGIEQFVDPAYMEKLAERIICLERAFNVREGFSRKDDTLPSRFLTEPLENAGPFTGQVVRNLDRLIDEYYDAMGYSKQGIPTFHRLEELGLAGIIKDIRKFTT